MSAAYRVVVAGAGFAGVATCVALLREWRGARPLSLTLLERSGGFGRGVAYATPDPQHLLNVPAGRMSAIAGRPGDLLTWAAARGVAAEEHTFLARGVYGAYLEDTLTEAERRAPGVLRRVTGEAVRVAPGEPATVVTRAGEQLAADAEAAARGDDWRAVVDSLRPVTQTLWRALPDTEKVRFVQRHARRWEVVRSRMAPEVASRVRGLMADGRLRVIGADVEGIERRGDGLAVAVRERGGMCWLASGAVVNCAGPAGDLRRGDSRLVRTLLDDGLATPGPAGLGLRTADDGALVDHRGASAAPIYTLGSLRRGELWETFAVPELREQAAELAAVLGDRASARTGRAA